MRSFIRIWLGTALCAMLLACRPQPQEADASPRVENGAIHFPNAHIPSNVKIEPVGGGEDEPRALSGRIVWNEDRTVRIFSAFNGRVARIAVRLGDRVKTGQTLAEMDSPDYGAAQADHRKALAASNLAAINLQRARALYEHGVIAAKSLEQAQNDAIAADADAERATRVLKQFGDNGDAINQRLALRSPIDGVVVERAINPGQEVRTDQTGAPLFVVTDPSTLWLALDAHEDDIDAVKQGDEIRFFAGPQRDAPHTARVLRIADYVDPLTRTIKLLAIVRNASRQLKGEMFVTAYLPPRSDSRPRVPTAAVLLLGERRFAFVKQGDSFARREVQVGEERNGHFPVIAGLKTGEEVVAEGALFLEQLLHSQPQG